CIEQARAQCHQHAGSSIIGGAASKSDQQALSATVQCRTDEFSHTMSGAVQGGALFPCQSLQATGFGEFDIGGARLRMPAPGGLARTSQGILNGCNAPFSTGGG